ncbi:MAG: protein PhnA [Methylophagaceae bacterium]|jgi:protein PhnA
MNTKQTLLARSNSKCELCNSETNLSVYEVPPVTDANADQCIFVCQTCLDQIENPENINPNHWRCLNDSMWTAVPAVQVMAWRQLKSLNTEMWAQDLLDMLYLDEETQTWAAATEVAEANAESSSVDSNGAILTAGDSVTLIKDLDVKGAGFTAKRGTLVKGISLTDKPEHIEGRVNGSRIVLLTKFLKKA